jgi:hypothetical protein
MSKIISFYLIVRIFLSYISKCEEINESKNIIELKGDNFDKLTTIPNTKWLIVFQGNGCFLCQVILNIISGSVITEYKDDNKTNFGIINCDDNFFICLRFNITTIPYVVLIEDDKIYQLKASINKDELINFINREKEKDDLFHITPIFHLVKLIHTIGIQAQHSIQILFKSLGIKENTNNYIIFVFIILLVIIAMFIMGEFTKMFYKKEKKNKKHIHNKTNNDKNTKDNTSTKMKTD